jgi:hypothetical protein
MNRPGYLHLITPVTLLILSALACGQSTAPSEPKTAVSPITLGSDLTAIDLCQAIPKEDMQAAMGRKLVSAPERFDYYGTPGASGCMFDAGKDSSGQAYYGYVVLTPVEAYNEQPLYLDADVSGIGEEAYFNNGADARQLWVKINEDAAFVVAFGDVANEDYEKALAQLVIAAIR